MKPLIRLVLPALMIVAPLGLRAQEDPPPTKSTLEELTKKIQSDPGARAEAGKSLEEFVLESDEGRSFTAGDANRSAIGAVAREWASKADAGKLARLVLVSTPNTPPKKRLRDALSSWNNQIKAQEEKETATAFFLDASAKAELVYGDKQTRAEIDAAITTNDGAGVAERDRAAIERARQLGSRTKVNTRAFGGDRSAGALGAGGQNPGVGGQPAGTGAGNTTQAIASFTPGAGEYKQGMGPRVEYGAYLPSANLPANFRRKSVSDVPPPSGEAGVGDQANTRGTVTAGGVGSVAVPTAVESSTKPVAAADDGTEKIKAVFHQTVARLTREGKRGAGNGTANGVMNNVRAMWDSKRLRCYDQAEELQADLEKKVGSGKNGWTYKMTSYTGEGHEANGHWWINAVNKDPKIHTLLLDPWSGEIKSDPSKEPVVIKGYFGWYFGAVMDKIMN